jgi:myo-inositol-1(or 4)-monophosphatase
MNPYKTFAESFAIIAGSIIKENFSLNMKKEWKSDNTPLTETDLKINRMLIEEVKLNFPDHRVRGEEESNLEGDSSYLWVCDPVDGTIPFSHGIPTSTFSLALVVDGKPTVGVVLDPFQNRLFSAVLGEGAYLNGEKIHVSKTSNLKDAAGAYEMFKRAKYDFNELQRVLTVEKDSIIFRLCSIIYPSMLVAAGELGYTIFPHGTAHDAAAVKIIVEEAGGKVTSIFGEEQRYDMETNGFIASNGVLHDELVELVKQCVK